MPSSLSAPRAPATWLPVVGVAVASLLALAPPVNATMISAARSSDNVLQGNFESGASNVYLTNNSNARRVGTGGATAATRVNQPVLGFTLPSIPAGKEIGKATFSITMDTPAFNSLADIDFDVVVSLMGGTSFTGADFVEVPGPAGLGAGNSLVGSLSVADTSDAEVESFALTGDSLAQLAGLYDASGTPSQAEVFFRLSTSSPIATDNGQNDQVRYQFARDGSPLLVSRSLVLTVVPEPSTLISLVLAGVVTAADRRRRG